MTGKSMEQRVLELEEDMERQEIAMSALTKAVTDLTTVLQQGKGALKFFMYSVMVISAAASAITWIIAHITFRG